PDELGAIYERADDLLKDSQDPRISDRLRSCVRKVFSLYGEQLEFDNAVEAAHNAPVNWKDFSFKREMRRYERFLIERALKDAGGVVTRAAQLLGFKHHYSLISLINKRHKNLLEARSPVVPRRRSIIGETRGRTRQADEKASHPVTILHVEDNQIVASAVKETLELEGWRVESCAEGTTALKRIASNTHYDLLLLDKELPGINGLELARTARKLSHRRRTPIIMFSARDCETEAWSAGVDAFLRKPQDTLAVVETITRLLDTRRGEP
ncbi:MAG TPA: response regulator, partial [Pyrinomonadaceae bacterium]|nr:response regulator [Pyrinomonadaceae bacterium]